SASSARTRRTTDQPDAAAPLRARFARSHDARGRSVRGSQRGIAHMAPTTTAPGTAPGAGASATRQLPRRLPPGPKLSALQRLVDGLLTSEGAMHLRQRRLMQPAFHRERIAGYGRTMAEYADRTRGGWTDGATLDIAQEMMRLTLSIAGKTLFDVDIEKQAG